MSLHSNDAMIPLRLGWILCLEYSLDTFWDIVDVFHASPSELK